MKPEQFVNRLFDAGFSPFLGIPCSVFKYLLNYLDAHNKIESYLCSSEGEAMGLAAGLSLSGRIPVVYMQNDGYGNTVNPLSSLQLIYSLPTLLLISWRAEPGKKDAPQHELMGKTILKLLDIFDIPYVILEDSLQNLANSTKRAKDYIIDKSKPFAFIIRKGYFEKYGTAIARTTNTQKLVRRVEYIKLLAKYISDNDIILGATGFTGRELYQCVDHRGKFCMVGSMGCLASIGLGIAKERPERNVFIMDGDGALLMKMGTLATIGYYQPKNFIHICFDNNSYESTGGQPTTASATDFVSVAKACGYKSVNKICTLGEFREILGNIEKYENPHFIHIRIEIGTIESLERPPDSPEEMKKKFMNFLQK